MSIMRRWQAAIAVLLYSTLLLSSVANAVVQSRQAAEQVIFGPASLVLCLSTDGTSADDLHRPTSSHHDGDCCVLCAINLTVRIFDIAALPHVIAYEGVSSEAEHPAISYPLPDIALSEGLFPHDIPARAPPFSAV